VALPLQGPLQVQMQTDIIIHIIQPFCRSSRLRFSITWANFGCGHVDTQCNMPKNSGQTKQT